MLPYERRHLLPGKVSGKVRKQCIIRQKLSSNGLDLRLRRDTQHYDILTVLDPAYLGSLMKHHAVEQFIKKLKKQNQDGIELPFRAWNNERNNLALEPEE